MNENFKPGEKRKEEKMYVKFAGICSDPLRLLRACSDLPSEQKVPRLQHYNGKGKTMMMIGKIKSVCSLERVEIPPTLCS